MSSELSLQLDLSEFRQISSLMNALGDATQYPLHGEYFGADNAWEWLGVEKDSPILQCRGTMTRFSFWLIETDKGKFFRDVIKEACLRTNLSLEYEENDVKSYEASLIAARGSIVNAPAKEVLSVDGRIGTLSYNPELLGLANAVLRNRYAILSSHVSYWVDKTIRNVTALEPHKAMLVTNDGVHLACRYGSLDCNDGPYLFCSEEERDLFNAYDNRIEWKKVATDTFITDVWHLDRYFDWDYRLRLAEPPKRVLCSGEEVREVQRLVHERSENEMAEYER